MSYIHILCITWKVDKGSEEDDHALCTNSLQASYRQKKPHAATFETDDNLSENVLEVREKWPLSKLYKEESSKKSPTKLLHIQTQR